MWLGKVFAVHVHTLGAAQRLGRRGSGAAYARPVCGLEHEVSSGRHSPTQAVDPQLPVHDAVQDSRWRTGHDRCEQPPLPRPASPWSPSWPQWVWAAAAQLDARTPARGGSALTATQTVAP